MKKKIYNQLVVAFVCALLGIFLAYQFKLLNAKDKNSLDGKTDTTDIMSEVEGLKKEKEQLQTQNNKLYEELKTIEENAAKDGSITNEMKNQLEKSRMILGTTDVKGPGIVLTLTTKSSVFSPNESDYITDDELIHVVNLLNYSGAEAISINDIRVTPQTGIKAASNYIWIGNNDRVSPKDKIVIKVIGDRTNLEGGLNFVGALDYGALARSYDKKISPESEIKIPKSTQKITTDSIKIDK